MLQNKLHVSVARVTEAQNNKKKKRKEEENSGLSFKTKQLPLNTQFTFPSAPLEATNIFDNIFYHGTWVSKSVRVSYYWILLITNLLIKNLIHYFSKSLFFPTFYNIPLRFPDRKNYFSLTLSYQWLKKKYDMMWQGHCMTYQKAWQEDTWYSTQPWQKRSPASKHTVDHTQTRVPLPVKKRNSLSKIRVANHIYLKFCETLCYCTDLVILDAKGQSCFTIS